MKNRRGMAVATAFLAAAALAAGFFLPDLAGRVADQKLSVQAETFAIGKVPSAADARLVDMLKLADTYENELYLDHGAISGENDIRISAADIINRLSEHGVLDKIECEDFSLSPLIAVKGKMLSDDAYGYDDADNIASTGNIEENTADTSDQSDHGAGAQMGIIWKCYASDPQTGIDLELLIDDRSGKMLSFGFTRYGGNPGAGEGYQNEEEINKEIQEDLQEKSAGLQAFCEEYYGFRHTDTEYHTESPSCFARILFEDESGENITLDLKRDQYGNVYTWNRTL